MADNHSQARKTPGRGLVFFVFVAVLGLWLASMVFVPWAAAKYYSLEACHQTTAKTLADERIERECRNGRQVAFGTFGDSFGAVNALFSGLALAGVVLTLFFHSEGAKRAAKPFIVPKLRRGDGDARVTVGAPTRAGARVHLPLKVSFNLQNESAHAALNIDSSLSIDGVGEMAVNVIDVPLVAANVAPCVFELAVVGDEANAFVQSVRGDGVKASLRVVYESIEGVRWFSEVAYVLKVNANREEDGRLLGDAVDGALAAENLWAADATVDLEFEAVSGSWSYGEA